MIISNLTEVLSELISVFAMVAVLFFLKNKKANNPKFELYGQPVNTLITFAYVGIGIFLLLAIVKLVQ